MFDWASGEKFSNGEPYYKWIGNELYKMDEDDTKWSSRPRGYKGKLP